MCKLYVCLDSALSTTCMWPQVPSSKNIVATCRSCARVYETVPHSHSHRPRSIGPEGAPTIGGELSFRIHPKVPLVPIPTTPPGLARATSPHMTPQERQPYSLTQPAACPALPCKTVEERTSEPPLKPFVLFFSRYRHQPLCTVSSRTRYFSPPTHNSQGPWATPNHPQHSPSPYVLPEGSAVCLSRQASSSRPDNAPALKSGHNQL